MFKYREMKKEVKSIKKFLRSMRKSLLKEGKNYEFVGYTLCLRKPLTQEQYSKLAKLCKRKRVSVEVSDIGTGCYWFKYE